MILKKKNVAEKKKLLKRTVYNELVKNVNAINTRGLVKKTDYDATMSDIESKTPSITSLATKVVYNRVFWHTRRWGLEQ